MQIFQVYAKGVFQVRTKERGKQKEALSCLFLDAACEWRMVAPTEHVYTSRYPLYLLYSLSECLIQSHLFPELLFQQSLSPRIKKGMNKYQKQMWLPTK